ncbi:thiamine pyrophosphate-binding protein [Mycolicibacterium sp.]|uniref:thiamine pyrophosphate-binding protein n=1 Tax=Mycolicibacterium sp. TaxID=2320850 RepID=UPI003D12CE12
MTGPGAQPAPTGVDRLADVLVEAGVDTVFGLPGVHNLPAWQAFTARGIRIVGVRHEQTAAYAADGYARATGRLGVALVTTGPGAANTVTGTGEAFTVGSPILVIATDIETTVRRPGVFRGALHECADQAAMFAPVTKAAYTCRRADELGPVARLAVRTALAAPTRPVYLGVPFDLFTGPAPTPLPPLPVEPAAAPTPSSAEIAEAAGRINAATAPFIWAGGGAVSAGAGPRIAELAERIGAPVATTYKARGILGDHRLALRSPVQVARVEQMFTEADLVIAIGTDFDGISTRSWKIAAPRQLLTVNVDATDAGKNYLPDQSLEGDAAAVLDMLLPHVIGTGRAPAVAARIRTVDAAVRADAAVECPEAVGFLDAIETTLSAQTNVVVDMCVAGYWLGGFGRILAQRKLAYPVGWGTLGFALPASVGTSAAGTGPTVVVIGDGGFLFAAGELATLRQEQLPVTIVVVDDKGYGMLKFAQDHAGLPNQGVALDTPDFARLAEAFGLPCRHVHGLGPDFAAALTDAVNSAVPNLIWAETRTLLPPPTTSTRSADAGQKAGVR